MNSQSNQNHGLSKPWETHGRLIVSADGRRLEHTDGTPFVWLGETAWALHQNLSREDVVLFLDNCVKTGFTVIQLMTTNTWALRDGKNFYGHEPHIDQTAWRLNPPYWEHLGWVIDQAAERGFCVFLVFGSPGRSDNHGPTVTTPEEAYAYGRALGAFFADKPNIIWSSGIDVDPENPKLQTGMGMDGWHAMAEGVFEGVTGEGAFDGKADWSALLMTYHSNGAHSSALWFHDAPWLSFNAAQVGLPPNALEILGSIERDRARTPAKPIVNVEPWYEACDWKKPPVSDWETRLQLYQSIFAGSSGVTYGHHHIFPLDSRVLVNPDGQTPAADVPTDSNGTLTRDREHLWRPLTGGAWIPALEAPARTQMPHLRRILDDLAANRCEPLSGFITGAPEGALTSLNVKERIVALASAKRDFVAVYSPAGAGFTLALNMPAGPRIEARWMDPRNGETLDIGKVAAGGDQSFQPPGETGEGQDWILTLKSESA